MPRALLVKNGIGVLLMSAASIASFAQSSPFEPVVHEASDEAEQQIKSFQTMPGLAVELFAAEPELANPVAFCIDEQGRFYVAETFRLGQGVSDIRGRNRWPNRKFYDSISEERRDNINDELLDGDLALKSVGDRIAYYKKYKGEEAAEWAKAADRIKMLEDRDGDGKVDRSTVFADGFDGLPSGIGAGLLARKGQVWYTDIPNLWRLRDRNEDGVADERTSLHYGFGVRTGFLGHDMHGLRMGPDGKLYFSIGDRAAHVELPDGRSVGRTDTGAVYRCNPDGSQLELFAYGLRNPQELTFDDYGNLFTGDNNSDSGDRSRIVYLVEGGDSGWRIGYQFMERSESNNKPESRGPWNMEKLWYPQWEGQAAYLIPPVANLSNGPSGFTYYPGTGLRPEFKNHFFLCDFRGSPSTSGIYTFTLEPEGAGFELVNPQQFIWNVLVTDADFGVDGALYLSDWVAGWGQTGKGRLYRVVDPQHRDDPLIRETRRLLAEGMENRSQAELVKLLGHADRRVRLEAQFELVARNPSSISGLLRSARSGPNQLARLHAIWGLGQITDVQATVPIPQHAEIFRQLIDLLNDGDAEVRAQAAKVLGTARADAAFDGLVRLLQDASPRVRFFAVMSLGKLGRSDAIPAIQKMLVENNDADPYLRHAGVMALTRIHDLDALKKGITHEARPVRMATLLALRRLKRPEIAAFLNESDPLIVREAARAINDAPVDAATYELAEIVTRPQLDDPTMRRAIYANFRLGTAEAAERLAVLAAASDAPDSTRLEALNSLAEWPNPSGRDHVTGVWRPLIQSTRDAYLPAKALEKVLPSILVSSTPDSIRAAAARAAGVLKIHSAEENLFNVVSDRTASGETRADALEALFKLNSNRLLEAIKLASSDENRRLRITANRLQTRMDPANAAKQLAAILENGGLREQQEAFNDLARLENPDAERVLNDWTDRLLQDEVPWALRLDLLEAAKAKKSDPLQQKVEEYYSRQSGQDPLSGYKELRVGGDAENGRHIFFERADAACVRCHKIAGTGGEAGPDLTGIGTRATRDQILESILFPNRQIVEGFANHIITLKNGVKHIGIVQKETDDTLVLNSPEDGVVKIDKSKIEEHTQGLSGMPQGMIEIIQPKGVRDVVEFLANQK